MANKVVLLKLLSLSVDGSPVKLFGSIAHALILEAGAYKGKEHDYFFGVYQMRALHTYTIGRTHIQTVSNTI